MSLAEALGVGSEISPFLRWILRALIPNVAKESGEVLQLCFLLVHGVLPTIVGFGLGLL